MAKTKDSKRVRLALVPVSELPAKIVKGKITLLLSEEELKFLKDGEGVSYQRLATLTPDQVDMILSPELIFGGHILGFLDRFAEQDRVRRNEEERILLGKYSSYEALREADDKVWRLWKELKKVFANLQTEHKKALADFNKKH